MSDGSDDNETSIYARKRRFISLEKGKDYIVIKGKVVNANKNAYCFKDVFDMGSTNRDVFEPVCRPLIKRCLEGYNVMLVAYGTTGSGKTYSFVGIPEEGVLGLMPMTLVELMKMRPDVKLRLSVVEAYSDRSNVIRMYDCLKPGPPVGRANFLKKLSKNEIKDEEDVVQQINKAFKNAHIARTAKNPRSSRGHTFYIAEFDDRGIKSRFVFADLAGAEGYAAINKKWQETIGISSREYNTRKLEAGSINEGIAAFIVFLTELAGQRKPEKNKGQGVRFILTKLLGGIKIATTRVGVLFTLSPSDENETGTRKTLEVARRFGTFRFETEGKALTGKGILDQLSTKIDELTTKIDELEVEKRDLKKRIARYETADPSELTRENDELLRQIVILKEEIQEKDSEIETKENGSTFFK